MRIPVKLASARQITLLAKVFEGCGHVGLVKTLDGAGGSAELICTEDQQAEVRYILHLFDVYLKQGEQIEGAC